MPGLWFRADTAAANIERTIDTGRRADTKRTTELDRKASRAA
jgi:hypothetical protein